MRKVIILNDYFPAEVQADVQLAEPKLMHHTYIQEAIDRYVKPGDYVELNGTFNLDKNVGYRPDIYGTDGNIPSGASHITINGSQPCISIASHSNEWNFAGAKFIVHRFFNDGIHIREYTGVNVMNIGEWYTKRILEVDPEGKAAEDRLVLVRNPEKRWIPPIDGTSGGSIKGTKEFGFNTTVNTFELSYFRSNAVDTSKMTKELAGFDARYKDQIYPGGFPQDDGTLSPTWGKRCGGSYGNFHAAICICNNPELPQRKRDTASFRISGGYIRGFAYAGIEVGSIGTSKSEKIPNNYPDVEKYVVKNVTIENVIIEDVYESGIQRTRFDNLLIDNVIVRRSGAPDWSLQHFKPQSPGTTQVDPGYGISSGRVNQQGKLEIKNCVLVDCNRKGIDAHHGTSHVFKNNYIKAGVWGIQVALEEPQDDKTDPLWEHEICKYIIEGNEIHASYKGIDFANGSFGPSVRVQSNLWYMRLAVKVTDNIVHAPLCWYYNYAHDGFYIDGNTFIFSLPYGQPNMGGNETMKSHAFFHGTQDAVGRGIAVGDIITNNTIMNSVYGNFTNGFVIQPTCALRFEGNMVDTTPFRKRIIENSQEPFISTKSFVFRDGYRTNPFGINKPQIKPRFSDNIAIDRTNLNLDTAVTKLDDNSGILTEEDTALKTTVQNAFENTKIIPNTKAGVVDRVSSDPDVFFANWENIRTEGSNPPRGFRTIVSSKNPLVISPQNGADRNNPGVNTSATGVYADIEYPLRDDVAMDTVEFDVVIKSLSKNNVGTVLGTDVSTIMSCVIKDGTPTLLSSYKFSIDGAEQTVRTNIPIAFNQKYTIRVVTTLLKGRTRLRLGAPFNGNNQLTGDYSMINIYRGMDKIANP